MQPLYFGLVTFVVPRQLQSGFEGPLNQRKERFSVSHERKRTENTVQHLNTKKAVVVSAKKAVAASDRKAEKAAAASFPKAKKAAAASDCKTALQQRRQRHQTAKERRLQLHPIASMAHKMPRRIQGTS